MYVHRGNPSRASDKAVLLTDELGRTQTQSPSTVMDGSFFPDMCKCFAADRVLIHHINRYCFANKYAVLLLSHVILIKLLLCDTNILLRSFVSNHDTPILIDSDEYRIWRCCPHQMHHHSL